MIKDENFKKYLQKARRTRFIPLFCLDRNNQNAYISFVEDGKLELKSRSYTDVRLTKNNSDEIKIDAGSDLAIYASSNADRKFIDEFFR